MRGLLASLATLCCGCYHPTAATNVPCASNGDCPGSQVCELDLPTPVCVDSLPDASTVDGQPVNGPCSRDSDCASTVCAETDGKCVAADESLFVAPTGDDSNDCSQAAPCATISHALDLVDSKRHTIRVAMGAYDDAFVIAGGTDVLISGEIPDYAGTDITFAAGGAHDHVVEAQGTNIRIEGMAIHGGKAETIRSDSDLSLHHVAVLDNTNGGIDCNGCTLHLVDSLVANHTLIGVDVRGGGNASIHRSKVTGCKGGGVRVTNTSFDISSTFLVHNGNATTGLASFEIVNTAVTDPARFAYNTLADNASGGVSCNVATTVTSSVFSDNNGPVTAMCATQYSVFKNSNIAGPGNQMGDPLFVDQGNADYHITDGSPAIDHGDPGEHEDTDYDGDMRPLGIANDVGADEHE